MVTSPSILLLLLIASSGLTPLDGWEGDLRSRGKGPRPRFHLFGGKVTTAQRRDDVIAVMVTAVMVTAGKYAGEALTEQCGYCTLHSL